MEVHVDKFVKEYVSQMTGKSVDIERFVPDASGLTPEGMLAALGHPDIGRLGIQLMADFMAPTGSLYFDAIYGAFHGQRDIRGWLIPTMTEIEFIDFVPTAEPVFFDDGDGVSTLDEWQMFANIGDDKIPLSRGVSVRRYRDGWITWACDVYDTGPFRIPPPPDSGLEAAPLPPYPTVEWPINHEVPPTVVRTTDFVADANTFHPTDSVYHDPIFGVFHGREAIREWLCDIMPKVGNVEFAPIGPRLDNGTVMVQEWVQLAVQPDGSRVAIARGTSVRRTVDGQVVYACDYMDTAPLMDPTIQAACASAGATITPADILRYQEAK